GPRGPMSRATRAAYQRAHGAVVETNGNDALGNAARTLADSPLLWFRGGVILLPPSRTTTREGRDRHSATAKTNAKQRVPRRATPSGRDAWRGELSNAKQAVWNRHVSAAGRATRVHDRHEDRQDREARGARQLGHTTRAVGRRETKSRGASTRENDRARRRTRVRSRDRVCAGRQRRVRRVDGIAGGSRSHAPAAGSTD